MKLRMGTRGSALALAQSGQAARALESLTGGLSVETIVITTSGDRFQGQPEGAERSVPGGAKGLFVKEIEEALLRGEIDFAVHSGKDLPADLAPGLLIAAYPERADVRDVFVGRAGLKWKDLGPGHRIGTGAPRRAVQLKARCGAQAWPLRGNVDTRLRKLAEGACDGLLLAAAGLERLGRDDIEREFVPPDEIVPAPAQGALALQAREDRRDVCAVVGRLDHRPTREAVLCERAFMKAMAGGCATPLGAYARFEGDVPVFSAFWSREDGSGLVTFERREAPSSAISTSMADAAVAFVKSQPR